MKGRKGTVTRKVKKRVAGSLVMTRVQYAAGRARRTRPVRRPGPSRRSGGD